MNSLLIQSSTQLWGHLWFPACLQPSRWLLLTLLQLECLIKVSLMSFWHELLTNFWFPQVLMRKARDFCTKTSSTASSKPWESKASGLFTKASELTTWELPLIQCWILWSGNNSKSGKICIMKVWRTLSENSTLKLCVHYLLAIKRFTIFEEKARRAKDALFFSFRIEITFDRGSHHFNSFLVLFLAWCSFLHQLQPLLNAWIWREIKVKDFECGDRCKNR